MTKGPVEAQHYEIMNALARLLSEQLKGFGFSLLVFDMNTHDGRMNYISNAARDDMLVAMKEFIAHNEGRMMAEPGRQ